MNSYVYSISLCFYHDRFSDINTFTMYYGGTAPRNLRNEK